MHLCHEPALSATKIASSPMTYPDLILFFAAAFAGGAVNSVAGGGTFLTFPLLIVNGLSALQANILSTIALWPGAVASAFAYRNEQPVAKEQMKSLILVSLIGSAIGAAILLVAPEAVFERLVPWLLLIATLLLTFGDKVKLLPRKSADSRMRRAEGSRSLLTSFFNSTSAVDRVGSKLICIQFIISIYGGYFGAGMGILMLAGLQLAGFTHMHQMNALKTILGSAINAVAVIIFVLSGKVVWALAPIMILGGIAGGWVGAKLALKISPQKVRAFVIMIGFIMSGYFFITGA